MEDELRYLELLVMWERLRRLVFAELGVDSDLPRRRPMTPKFRGVASAFAKLQHNLDHDAEKLTAKIETADARRQAVFAKSHEKLDATHKELDGIDEFLEAMDKTNAGPLDGQPRSSDLMKE